MQGEGDGPERHSSVAAGVSAFSDGRQRVVNIFPADTAVEANNIASQRTSYKVGNRSKFRASQMSIDCKHQEKWKLLARKLGVQQGSIWTAN